MALPGFILISFFYSIPVFSIPKQIIDCEGIKAEIKILSESDGNRVKIIPSGGSKPYRIIFFEPGGRLISEDFKRQSFSGVPAGDYTVVIIDGHNCRKSIDFKVP